MACDTTFDLTLPYNMLCSWVEQRYRGTAAASSMGGTRFNVIRSYVLVLVASNPSNPFFIIEPIQLSASNDELFRTELFDGGAHIEPQSSYHSAIRF